MARTSDAKRNGQAQPTQESEMRGDRKPPLGGVLQTLPRQKCLVVAHEGERNVADLQCFVAQWGDKQMDRH